MLRSTSRLGSGMIRHHVMTSKIDIQNLVTVQQAAKVLNVTPAAIHKAIKVRHGMVEVRDSISFGVPIKHAYIITSQRENSPRSRTPQPA